jgi:hypothetical protein
MALVVKENILANPLGVRFFAYEANIVSSGSDRGIDPGAFFPAEAVSFWVFGSFLAPGKLLPV